MTAGNGYSGNNTINAGTLQIGNAGAGGFLGGTFVNNSSLVINRSGGAPGVGAISGTGSVTLTSGTGLALNASNSYEGGFNYNGGSLAAFAAGTFNGFGTGTLTINSGAGAFQMVTGSPTVTLNNNIQWNQATTNFTRATSGTPTVDFNGDVTLGQPTTININSAAYAINFVFDGNIGDGGSGYGLSMTGGNGGSLTLNGVNTYTGATTVSNGTVKLGASGSLAAGGRVSISAGATFDLTEKTTASATYTWNTTSLSASGAATSATISGTAGGTIDMEDKPITLTTNGINPSLTVTGAALTLDNNPFTVVVSGPALTAGVYTLVSADSITGTVNPTASYTGGNGLVEGATGVVSISGNSVILTVTGGGTPYQLWAGPGVNFDDDANGDGVSNGLAFLLGAGGPNDNALDLLPEVTESGGGLVLKNFTMRDAASRGSTTLSVEYSSDLGIGDPWVAALVPDEDNTVNDVVFDISGSGTLGVEATIPVSKAFGGKLFGRLKAEQP